jgi:hypothetical protein
VGYTAVIQLVGNFSKVMLSFNFDSWGGKQKSTCWEVFCTHKKENERIMEIALIMRSMVMIPRG